MSKAPNLRHVPSCHNCAESDPSPRAVYPGGLIVECYKHEDVYCSYNTFICDDYKESVKVWEEE